MTPESPELSPLERIKSQSDYLRGRIAAELAGQSDHFSDDSAQLLKFHGIYQQDDRDRRQHLGQPGGRADARAYSFMVRTAPARRPALAASNCWPSWTFATRWATARCGSPAGRTCKSTAWRNATWSGRCGRSARGGADHAGRRRRRGAQRHRAARRRIAATRSTARCRGWPATWPRSCARACPPIGKSGWATPGPLAGGRQ